MANITITNEKLRRLPGWHLNSSIPGELEDCSLIVATYQRPEELQLLIRTLADLPDAPAEVVIVDGSPNNLTEAGLANLVAERNLPFDLVYAKSPAGLTRQRNVGIDLSSREYVYFLDDDCLPEPGYFREIRRVFKEDKADEIGAVCGLIANEMSNPVTLRWRIRLALRLVPRVEPGIYHPSGTSVPRNLIKPFRGVRPVDVLSGCSMAFRRSIFDQHRFSEFFYGYAQGEDLEMSLRVRRHWQIMWCGDAPCIHNHAPSGRPASFQKGVMEVRNRYFIWKRYSVDARLKDKIRFWLDMLFLILMDTLWVIIHPRHYHSLSHALGLIWGVIGCLTSPPHHEEPLARKQYHLSPNAGYQG
jgi:GT2 family glycosyltransferase